MEQKTKYTMKIAFTGPESCGKTTMAKWFSLEFNLPLSEEFARQYLTDKEHYERQDLDIITIGQLADWKLMGNHFVADTEMTVMKIWSEFRYQQLSSTIREACETQEFDHYFLCAPDIPWEPDPLRENPLNREELFVLYETELVLHKRPFTVLKGTLEERQKVVKFILQDLLNC
jgi:nicotinamide riboside kinase